MPACSSSNQAHAPSLANIPEQGIPNFSMPKPPKMH